MTQQTIKVSGMHCRSCELLLEDDLGKLDGVKAVTANFEQGEVKLTYEGTVPNMLAVEEVVQQAGYRLGEGTSQRAWFSREASDYGRLLFAAAGLFLVALLFQGAGGVSFLPTVSAINVRELSLVFLVGLTAGVSTCAALVGGLVLALSARYNQAHADLSPKQKLIPHFWFHLGRVGGFFLLGTLLGFLGEWLSGSIVLTAFLTLLAGAVMFLFGLQLTSIFPRLSRWNATLPKGLARFFGITENRGTKYSHGGAVLGGVATFFLPCGFTQAMQLSVVALGSPLLGGVVMALFAIGTLPGLLAIGSIAAFAAGKARVWLNPILAVVLIVFGGWNLSNGLQLFGITSPVLQKPAPVNEGQLAPLEDGVQVIRMVQDAEGYHPSTLPVLRAGIPARLIVDSQESYTCASSLVIPEYGIKRQLSPGENSIEFIPTETGTLPFSCSMGMFRGSLQVIK